MTGTVGIIGGQGAQLEALVKAGGMRPIILNGDQLVTPGKPFAAPDVILVDVREDRALLALTAAIKRRHPSMGVAIVAAALDGELMLEAMRAGVTECVTEPLTQGSIEAAIARVMGGLAAPVEGRVFAFIGAKGGVGSSTIAVNTAEAFARTAGSALLIDLHADGDAAVFLGVEPRFTVVEALENTHRLDEAFFRGLVAHTRSGLDLLASSPDIARGHVDRQRIRSVIEFATRYYRTVVLDVPRGDTALLDALDVASKIFVVVNHELPTIRRAYRLLVTLRSRYESDRIELLVNRSDKQAEISLTDIEKAVNARVKHAFPSDYKQATDAVNKGEPFAKSAQGRLAGSFHAFVRVLSGQEKSEPGDGTRLFGRLTPRSSRAE